MLPFNGLITPIKAFSIPADMATADFGKWHVGPEPFSPLQHGFDVPHTNTPLYAAIVRHTDDPIGRVWQAVEEG